MHPEFAADLGDRSVGLFTHLHGSLFVFQCVTSQFFLRHQRRSNESLHSQSRAHYSWGTPNYIRRALHTAENCGLGVGVVHSHPSGYWTKPSALDDNMDTYFARELLSYTGGKPYCSLILERNTKGDLSFSGRVYDRGEWLPVKIMFTVGEIIERHHSALIPDTASYKSDREGESTTARMEGLLGEISANRLRSATIGVIGCSGTGTPAVHALARANVGEFVLVDPQRFSPSNMERFHGASYEHLVSDPPDYKVEILEQLIRSINPDSRVTTFAGNALQDNVLEALLRCDLLLGCTDSVHGRVFLSDVAKHYLLPSLDVGVDMNGEDGRITSQLVQLTQYSPELPCIFCNDLIDTGEMAVELMSDEEREQRKEEAELAGVDQNQYWRGARQIHTVGYLTSMAGAMMSGYATGWLTGAFTMPHHGFQFDIGKPRLAAIPTLTSQETCNCNERIGWADQARSYRNFARPTHWTPKAVLLSSD